MNLTIVTFAERPELAETALNLQASGWHEFALNDIAANQYWDQMIERFPDYQFMALDDDGNIVAIGNSIPLVWDGDTNSLSDDGFGWGITKGCADFDRGDTPNTLCAMSITVLPQHQGSGLSAKMVTFMRGIAEKHGYANLIAAVRPNMKHLYPLTPIDRYIKWTNDKGEPFDAWLRVHWKLGAQIIKPSSSSMRVEGTVAQWERWTQMRFPETGTYIVPGALVPVDMNVEADLGVYIEPNVWMVHKAAVSD